MNAPEKIVAETVRTNVYGKLQKARVLMQARQMKKSGKNTYSDYTYFELEDFLPAANQTLGEVGLCSVVRFTKDEATLTVVDIDNPGSEIIFTSPMADAVLKGCHPVQNMGASQTYVRRYLYLVALEIAEHDAMDSAVGLEEMKSDELLAKLKEQAAKGMAALAAFVTMLKGEDSKKLWESNREALEQMAKQADAPKPYDQRDYAKNLASWTKLIQSGKSTPEQIVAKLTSKYTISDEQRATLMGITKQEGAEE